MHIILLVCPLSEKYKAQGPITNTFYSSYPLTDEEIELYEILASLPKPDLGKAEPGKKSKAGSRKSRTRNKSKDQNGISSHPSSNPDPKPDFHPVDCPAQFPSEPE